MIDRHHGLRLGGQATALGISRGSVYSLPRPTSDADLVLMRRIDELHLDTSKNSIFGLENEGAPPWRRQAGGLGPADGRRPAA
jgi:hypothetical protein